METIYLIITLFATTIGTMVGMGGGVIIKPALDALADYNVFATGVLSSTTVMVMALIASINHLMSGKKFDKNLFILAISSAAGGYLGKELFELSYVIFSPDRLTSLQAIINIQLLLLALFMTRFNTKQINNIKWVMLTGIILGGVSAYLGIGGGPINVAVLTMFFGMDIKEAAAGSIFIILFSQITNLFSTYMSNGFGNYDYSVLLYMIPASILGGCLGPLLRKRVSHSSVKLVYTLVVISVIGLNTYNIVY